MGGTVGFVRDAIFSFLPEYYRPASSSPESKLLAPCRVACALVFMPCFIFLVASMYTYSQETIEAMTAGPSIEENPTLLFAGPVLFFNFLSDPLNAIALYLFLESVSRSYITLSGQVCGMFPLHIASWVHRAATPRYREFAQGKRIPDRVEWVEGKKYDLVVGTCRRKPSWDRLITIRYQERFYEVLKETPGTSPYRFRYLLRRNPLSRVTRKIYDYNPDQVLEC
jgi:hypothetical protein